MEPADLEACIRLAQGGDQKAFYALFLRFRDQVYAVCVRMLSHPQHAEDATQEVFLRVWQQLPGFRGDSQFSTWLHTVATRTAIDVWRKLKRHSDHDDDSALDMMAAPDRAETGVHQRDLETGISRLPDQARAVFVLFALEGYTHQEIAESLDIAVGSSKSQYHRARQLLRSWLDED